MSKFSTPQEIADRAKTLYQAGDYSNAALTYGEAATAYSGGGDALMAAEMKNNQSVAHLRNKQAQAALDAAQGTEMVFGEAGDARRQGMALANQASALEALKRTKDAIALYTQASESLHTAGEVNLRLEVMQLLSILYLRRFKFFDAVITLQSGLAAVKDPTPRQRFMKKILFFRL
jgi:tetratricopeptide (TPR) repeat protein